MRLDELIKVFEGADAYRNTAEVELSDLRAWHAEIERLRADLARVRARPK